MPHHRPLADWRQFIVLRIRRIGVRAGALALLAATWVVAAATGFSRAPSWVALIAAFLCLPTAVVGTVRPWRRGRRTVLTALACVAVLYVGYCGMLGWRARAAQPLWWGIDNPTERLEALGPQVEGETQPDSVRSRATLLELVFPDYSATHSGVAEPDWLGCGNCAMATSFRVRPDGPLAFDVESTEYWEVPGDWDWDRTRMDVLGRTTAEESGDGELFSPPWLPLPGV